MTIVVFALFKPSGMEIVIDVTKFILILHGAYGVGGFCSHCG